mgnify:CR=1 FL=1
MLKQRVINLICKLPPKWKRRLMLLIEGDKVWIHGGGDLGTAMAKAIERYVPAELQSDKDYQKKLARDIKHCFVKYGLQPAEYFYFGFESLSAAQRGGYLCNAEEDAVLIKVTGWDKYVTDLTDKYHFYELAKPFFKRAIMLFDKQTDKADFISYCLKVKDLFIKPLAGSEGDGAFTAQVNDETEAEQLYVKLAESNAKWMVEERIKQDEEMNAWNASSVNTVRLPSFLNKQGFFVLAPIFRTGRAGKSVDNTSAGGVFALIDPQTGKLVSQGNDINNHTYESHPDSHKVFEGYKIPKWEELIKVAESVHRTFSSHIYIAWDFALTEKGWDLIEGNWGRFRGAQIAGHKGIKKEFLEYMKGGSLT